MNKELYNKHLSTSAKLRLAAYRRIRTRPTREEALSQILNDVATLHFIIKEEEAKNRQEEGARNEEQ